MKTDISTLLTFAVAGALLLALITWVGIFLFRQWQVKSFARASLPFPNKHSRFIKVDEVKLHYVVFGMGQDLVLVHGLGANIFCWRLLIPLLSKHFRVWAVDLKGFGCSDKPKNSSYTLDAQAKLLLRFLEVQDISQAIVVGNSMGGAIAAEMAIQDHKRVPQIVLINSAHDPKIMRRVMWMDLRWLRNLLVMPVAPLINRQTIKQFLRMLYGTRQKVTPEIVDAYIAPYMQGLDAHWAFAQAIDAILDDGLPHRLKTCKAKTLILWGDKDLLTPVKYGKSLHSELPDSVFKSHPRGGHHIQEEFPEWITESILQFVEK